MADSLVVDIYPATKDFPREERYGLQAQIRRASVSTVTNVVEGSARRSCREYVHFLNIATGSASEVRYLIDLSCRLGFLSEGRVKGFDSRCHNLIGSLVRLMDSLGSEP